ncbi:Diguanylate cyclase (GGDEF) domain protein [Lysobacter dokdonensis DS-58]|uniref:diguanylate cyclase n=1 Tax=Lysobacter dokdonensis DS-58 TaxID=1300345 RepID=A0A0A2WQ63_9GAMM|nr:GGDEF domain-containing protein [Lysobacter dokdonensis]KGQ20440.1 Diguanylate cyclase (GGDEF) domain protein [Lysobacter dokdonensis DS-58]
MQEPPLSLANFFTRRSLRALTDAERAKVVEAQVHATRPIVSGVVASGAMILALTGMFELAGITPSIGWPWWASEIVALTAGACALAIWHLNDWRPRLMLTVLSVLLVGVFLSIPLPGVDQPTTGRAGLFQLMPIALLALMARRVSMVAIAAAMTAVAALRVGLHGHPPHGAALYWLTLVVAIGFGTMLGGYRTDFAVSTYRVRQKLREQATTDELTGLRNRAGWNREAGDAYDDAVKRGRRASVVFLDIDYFKKVNDTFGHAAGDQVIQRLGQILRERAGERCLCARLGGEEFVVMLIDQAPESVEGFVQRVRREFQEAARDAGVTVSAGVAHRVPAESMGQHMRRADLALYEAKAAGRDRMVVSKA